MNITNNTILGQGPACGISGSKQGRVTMPFSPSFFSRDKPWSMPRLAKMFIFPKMPNFTLFITEPISGTLLSLSVLRTTSYSPGFQVSGPLGNTVHMHLPSGARGWGNGWWGAGRVLATQLGCSSYFPLCLQHLSSLAGPSSVEWRWFCVVSSVTETAGVRIPPLEPWVPGRLGQSEPQTNSSLHSFLPTHLSNGGFGG